MTCSDHAVLHVNLAENTESTRWAGAAKVADQIVTGAAILTRIQPAVIDVQFTILSLEAFRALTLIGTHQILTNSPVLTRSRVAFVDFFLTIRTRVALGTVTPVTVSNVLASPIVAESLLRQALPNGSVLARDHLHVANLSGPARRAVAVIFVLVLYAGSLILAGTIRTPVDVLVATFTSVTVGTVTCVILNMIVTSSSVQARRTVTLVNSVLTVGTRVTRLTDARVIVYTVDALSAVHATAVGTVLVVGLTIDP